MPINWVGTAGDDDRDGTTGNDTLSGLDGQDLLSGLEGDDQLFGGTGNDSLGGGDGRDSIYGGTGNDVFLGGLGNDIFIGGDGDDSSYGDFISVPDDPGNDVFIGGAGNDVFFAGTGSDKGYGQDGFDDLVGDSGDDSLYGGNDADRLFGGEISEVYQSRSNSGRDLLDGGVGGDYLDGQDDNDTLYGGSGNDTLYGGEGNDLLRAGTGVDLLFADWGNDLIEILHADRVLSTGTELDGGTGTDTLRLSSTVNGAAFDLRRADITGIERLEFGVNGAVAKSVQLLLDQFGSSFTVRGNGAVGATNELILRMVVPGAVLLDLITFENWRAATDRIQLLGTTESDSVIGSDWSDSLVGFDGNDTLRGSDGNDTILGGAGDDVMDGGIGNDRLDGGLGNDRLTAGTSTDNLAGGDGDDVILLASGVSRGTWDGGAGSDALQVSTSLGTTLYDLRGVALTEFETLSFATGGFNSTRNVMLDAQQFGAAGLTLSLNIVGANQSGKVEGLQIFLNGATVFSAAGFTFTTFGEQLDRVTITGGALNDTITGSLAADLLQGAGGNDLLLAGAGNDRVEGGLGKDLMRGAAGADTFLFTSALESTAGALRDVIADFASGTDKIDLSALAGVLVFRGGAGFTGTTAEVRVSATGLVQVDSDGNGAADMEISLKGAPVVASDFLL